MIRTGSHAAATPAHPAPIAMRPDATIMWLALMVRVSGQSRNVASRLPGLEPSPPQQRGSVRKVRRVGAVPFGGWRAFHQLAIRPIGSGRPHMTAPVTCAQASSPRTICPAGNSGSPGA